MRFWADLYNELTVKLVLDHYPVSSVRDIDISPGLFESGPWGKKPIVIEGEALSLDDIEHRILRPIWRDPRIHCAVNCAALGLPQPAVFGFYCSKRPNPDRPNHARLCQPSAGCLGRPRRLTVSSICVWYQHDFGGTDPGVIDHLQRYARPELAAALVLIDRISGDRYDWGLNDLK